MTKKVNCFIEFLLSPPPLLGIYRQENSVQEGMGFGCVWVPALASWLAKWDACHCEPDQFSGPEPGSFWIFLTGLLIPKDNLLI